MTQGKKEILADLLQSARDELVKIDGSEEMSPTIRRAIQAELWLRRAAGLLENEVAPSRGLPKEELIPPLGPEMDPTTDYTFADSQLNDPAPEEVRIANKALVDERLGATEDS
jgi:hypothetical protein